MAKNLAETGNPVYPLLYGVFGGVDWNDAMHRKWQAAHPPGLLKGSWDDFAGVIYKNDWQSPLLFGLAPLALLGSRRKQVLEVAFYAAVLLAAWYLLTHRIDRFWVPMNPVMAVLAGIGLTNALNWNALAQKPPAPPTKTSRPKKGMVQRFELMPIAVRLVALTLVGGAVVYNFGFVTTPLCGYNAYLNSYAQAEEATKTPSVNVVERLQLPENAKVLFVGEAELFDAKFPYAYNTVFDQSLLEIWTSDQVASGEWVLKSPEAIRARFQEEGITHVFINWNEILRYRTTYGYTDFISPDRIHEFVNAELLTPIPLPDRIAARPWELLDESWKREIEKWGPSLKFLRRRQPEMLQFQILEVSPPRP